MADTVSRREFTKTIAVLGALPALPLAAVEPAPAAGLAPPAPASSSPDAATQAQTPHADALALAQVVNHRWGDRLTPEELGQVIQNIDAGLKRAAELYRIPLANADEPAFLFAPYRGTGGL